MIIYLIKLIIILVFNIGINTYYINSECKCCCSNSKSGGTGSGSKGNLSTNPPLGTNPILGTNPPVTQPYLKPQVEDHKGENRSGSKTNLCANPANDTNTTTMKKHEEAKPNNYHNSPKGTNPLYAAHWNKGGGKKVDKFEINLDKDTLKRNEDILTTGFEKIKDLTSTNPQRVINSRRNYGQNIYYTIDEDIFNSIKEDSIIKTVFSTMSDEYIVFAVKTQVKNFEKKNPKYDYYLVYYHNGNTVSDYYGLINGLFDKVDTNVEIKILGSGNNLIDISYMFFGCTNLNKITFNKTCFDTTKVTNMHSMFDGCDSLTSLNVSNFNTSNVTDMCAMFKDCSLLAELNVSNFNTSNVTIMEGMFYECNSLTSLNVSNFNTNKVTNMSYMFGGCSSLKELNLSNFNTSNVTTMEGMFYECNSLTSLDVSNFSTQNVTDMEEMFAGCTNLTSLILPNKVIHENLNISDMFYGCKKLSENNVFTNDVNVKYILKSKEQESNYFFKIT